MTPTLWLSLLIGLLQNEALAKDVRLAAMTIALADMQPSAVQGGGAGRAVR
jgi:hypothetical protein